MTQRAAPLHIMRLQPEILKSPFNGFSNQFYENAREGAMGAPPTESAAAFVAVSMEAAAHGVWLA